MSDWADPREKERREWTQAISKARRRKIKELMNVR